MRAHGVERQHDGEPRLERVPAQLELHPGRAEHEQQHQQRTLAADEERHGGDREEHRVHRPVVGQGPESAVQTET